MTYFMGIDGGGSTLRVAIIDDENQVIAEVTRGSANPNLIGREGSAHHIQATMREALATVESVAGVGIGIAGASAEYASGWLRETVHTVLPSVQVVASSDNEIALVGAFGRPQGILVLSGTGSGVFGINADGDKLQVGGWGYVLGDEGSGFWIGLQALKIATTLYDAGETSAFMDAIMKELNITTGRDIIEAVYLNESLVPTVAQLAPRVLALADEGYTEALAIVAQAIEDLSEQVSVAMKRLKMDNPEFAFAGSIIANDTPVSRGLCATLGLEKPPQALYRPVIGAALLARIRATTEATS